jgi:hypothetical protein
MAENGRLTHLPSSKRVVGGKSFPISCEHVLSTDWLAVKIGRLHSAVLVFTAVTVVVILGGRPKEWWWLLWPRCGNRHLSNARCLSRQMHGLLC